MNKSVKEYQLPNAIYSIQDLLKKEAVTSDEVHAVKSLLYIAIERLGMKVDRLTSTQRLLRELFAILNKMVDIRDYEKNVADQLIIDLVERYENELKEAC